ncbi:MAG: hypothetical protein AAF604_16930 [Acidobacteriota bacterium]
MKLKYIAMVVAVLMVAMGVYADLYYDSKADYRNGIVAGETPPAGTDDCSSPTVIPGVGPGGMFSDGGTTVGNTDTVGTVPIGCNGNYTTVAGPDEIYTFTTGGGNNATFTVTTSDANYDPSIYILTTCNDGTSCVAGSDDCFAANAGGNPCGAVSDETIGPVALAGATQHFFYVDSFYAVGGTRDDGPYNLTITGPLPVELIEFTIE